MSGSGVEGAVTVDDRVADRLGRVIAGQVLVRRLVAAIQEIVELQQPHAVLRI